MDGWEGRTEARHSAPAEHCGSRGGVQSVQGTPTSGQQPVKGTEDGCRSKPIHDRDKTVDSSAETTPQELVSAKQNGTGKNDCTVEPEKGTFYS